VEFLGFAVPALVGVSTAHSPTALSLPALLVAGAFEGALLGFGQARALRLALPNLPTRSWIISIAAAAAFAYLFGLSPSLIADSSLQPSTAQLVIGWSRNRSASPRLHRNSPMAHPASTAGPSGQLGHHHNRRLACRARCLPHLRNATLATGPATGTPTRDRRRRRSTDGRDRCGAHGSCPAPARPVTRLLPAASVWDLRHVGGTFGPRHSPRVRLHLGAAAPACREAWRLSLFRKVA
jgi:hypothetical protein